MAVTEEGRELTEAQRVEQVRIAARLIAALRSLWPILDLNDLDASSPTWLAAVMLVLEREFRSSSAAAAAYFTAFRAAEISAAPIAVVAAQTLGAAALVSMQVTGPVDIKSRIGAGTAPQLAKEQAFQLLASTAQLHVLNGGRSTLQANVRADRRAIGYQRVTDGDPCYFCAMLASRGPVYRKSSFPNGKVHRGCGCTIEAVYSRRTEWVGRAAEFRELWDRTMRDREPGSDPVAAFRSAYSAHH